MPRAKRLISLSELDEIRGSTEHHREFQGRIKVMEADAVQFDTPTREVPVPARKATGLRRDLATLLGRVVGRVKR